MSIVTLYTKPDCHLCDEAHEVIERVRDDHGFELDVVDISRHADLEGRYGERVPVVLIDGEEAFVYRVDAVHMRAKLSAGEPVGPLTRPQERPATA
jgi:glutaredoxin